MHNHAEKYSSPHQQCQLAAAARPRRLAQHRVDAAIAAKSLRKLKT